MLLVGRSLARKGPCCLFILFLDGADAEKNNKPETGWRKNKFT